MDGTALSIQGEPDVIGEISALFQESEDAEVVRVDEDDQGGIGADFDLDSVATVITIVSALFFDGPVVPKLWAVLHRHRGTKITIETPRQTIRIEATGDLTPDSLQTALNALIQH